MQLPYQLLIVVAFLGSSLSQSNPLKNPNKCGSPTCSENGKFKYGPGTIQNYEYSVEVRTSFNGTSKKESTLFIEATANLAFPTQCEGILTLYDVKLTEYIPSDHSENEEDHPNTDLFAEELKKYPLRFAFKDGIISELCPSELEVEWALNFKRGVLNMLHNSMKRFDLDISLDEEDIRGKCPTQYKVLGAKETSLLIEKTKDLSQCIGIGKMHSAVQSTPVPFFSSRAKKENILKSSSHCTLSIDHNIYNQITCQEHHLLQPFSNHDEGATTVVSQTLSLIDEQQTSQQINNEEEITRRVSLMFDHIFTTKPTNDDTNEARKLISKLCQFDKQRDRLDLSDIFSQLIYNLKSVSYPAITKFYEHSGSICSAGRKHFLDALPFVNSGPSVALMKDIILSNGVPENTVQQWLMSLAFISDPDKSIIEAAANLFQMKKFSPNIAFSVTSLAHTYCTQHTNCNQEYAIFSIVEYLENYIRGSYNQNLHDRLTFDNIIIALKSLSNIGVLSDDFQEFLFEMIENSDLDSGLKVAAVETFRRTACYDTRTYFEQLFRNQDVDSEVRISAYLQMMQCPDYLLIRTVRHALQEEEVNQVGSFVWTHLKNLIKSSVPTKVEIQSLLSEKDLVKKFNNDVRKFSRNFEGGLYFDNYNVGGSFESNLIFSSSSFIPKSAMLNLTTVLFGESVNLLEVYGRLDGFEHYLESLFGPRGSSKSVKDDLMDKVRWPRNADKDHILRNEIEKLPNVMNSAEKDPKIALGYKIFGNELKYTSFNGKKEIRNAMEDIDPAHILKKIFSGKEINYNKATMFLDTKFVIPSGAGLPLSLSATGTASVNVKIFGSLKSTGFSNINEVEVDLSADIRPTVSVDVTGEMSVDAFYASTGIKLKINMFTDTAVQSHIKIQGTNLIRANFSLPKEKNEIFVAKSELLVKRNNKEEPQENNLLKRVSNSMCTWSPIENTFGLRLCAEYNYLNISKMENIPYFLVAGPAYFRYYLHKSDPTANIYLFEYKWTREEDYNATSIIFDTPGSKIKRLLSINFTVNDEGQNLTLFLESSAGIVIAKGRYKNLPFEKALQFTVSINDKQHFDASASLLTKPIRNGFLYTPTVYIEINGERILLFSGQVEFISKKGVSQYTIDVMFVTKRFTSKTFGYISTSESSYIEASLYTDYKFQNTKEQRLSIKFGAANRSRRNIVILLGFCNLNSTAYPNFNVDGNVTYQRSGSHMDLSVKLKQNPLTEDHPEADYRTLNSELLVSYKTFTDNKCTLTAEASINRKSSNLDLKGEFLYETVRHNINAAGVVKYGNNKEVSVTVFWSRPRSTLEQIRTHINITVPSFMPMILKVAIEEKQPKYYMVDFEGTWFSGHSMSAIGFYQDKSKATSSNHHMKLLLKSPSFKDIQLDMMYYRDNTVFKLNCEALHDNKDEYALLIIHQYVSNIETETHASVKYKTKLYKFASSVYDGDYKKIDAEIHIDQMRDINFSLYLLNEEKNKSIIFNINWDANRDPNQKLMLTANYKKNAAFDYLSNFILSYPGRTVKGDYKFLLERGHFDTIIGLAWEEGKTLALNLDVKYENEKRLFLDVHCLVHTPLVNWKVTNFQGTFEHLDNKYDLHGVLIWDRRNRVGIDVFSDYSTTGSQYWCRNSASISSSVDTIQNINATLWYLQDPSNLKTNIYFKYNPEFIIDIDSVWKIEEDNHFSNLTGSIQSKTPFKGIKDGFLISKLIVKDRKYLKGVAELTIDHQEYSISMDGKFKKLTDCMLIVNATTLEDDYQLRFIISTENKHFVSMLSYPTGNLGVEVLLLFNSFVDFDIKFHLGTPIEFLQKILIVAKLNSEQADLRLGWNALLLGVSGIWHYGGITDFHYSLVVYTPLTHFEENYIVAKLIADEGLDINVAVKLSIYKLGLKLYGKDKPQFLKQIGLNIKNLKMYSKVGENSDDIDEISWKGLVEVDIIIYPTMKGALEIDQRGMKYFVRSKLTMPYGVAVLIDEFEFIDIYNIKNDLNITTPYLSFKTITSLFELDISTGNRYIFGFNVDYQNRTRLMETGVYVKYDAQIKEIDEKTYEVVLKVKTPFKSFPKLDLQGLFESADDEYHTKLLVKTNTSDIHVDALTVIEKGTLDFSSSFHVMTPSIFVPKSNLRISKVSTPTNNDLEVNLNSDSQLSSDIYLKMSWFITSKTKFRALIELETPFNGLDKTKVGGDVDLSKDRSSIWAIAFMNPVEMELNSTLNSDKLLSTSKLHFNGKSYPLSVDCNIQKVGADKRKFDGTLTLSNKIFKIIGDADISGNIYSRAHIELIPEDKSYPVIFDYQIIPKSMNEYEMGGVIQHLGKRITFNAHLLASDKLNWDLNLQIVTTRLDTFRINAKANSDMESVNLIVNGDTPITNLEHPQLGLNYKTSGYQRTVYGFFEMAQVKGNANIRIIWNFLENMYIKAVGQFEGKNYASQSAVEAFYENPQKTYYFVSAGGDIRIDKIWEAGSNVTLKLPPQNSMGLEGHFKVPDENRETHSLYANLDYTGKIEDIVYFLKYRTSYTLKKYGTWGKIFTRDKNNLVGDLTFEWNGLPYNNFANWKTLRNDTVDLMYKLKTPKYIDKQLFIGNIKYTPKGDHHNIFCEAFSPEDNKVVYATVDYKELANMNGMFNITVPHKSFNYTGAYFNTETTDVVTNRYYKVFWQGNDGVVDSKCSVTSGSSLLNSFTHGKLILEIPLKTRHIAEIDYEYDKKSELSRGKATVDYNKEQVLQGLYSCITEAKAGIDKDTVHVELENKFLPLGADYVHKYQYGATTDDDTTDNKYLRLYNLRSHSKFDVTGELDVHNVWGGQEYTVTIGHSNRTVKLYADYTIFDQIYKQHSRIELNPTHWLEYELNLINKTKDEIFDSQEAILTISYPKRSFTANGFYNISDMIILSDLSFEWDTDKKRVEAGIDWRKISAHRDQLTLKIKHPSFEKDVLLDGQYGYGKKSMDGYLIVDYALDSNRRLSLGGEIKDNSDCCTYNYSSKVWAEHNATNLKLDSDINVYWNPTVFISEHITNYQRSYLPVSKSETFVKIHFDDNEIELKKDTIATGYSYFWGKYGGNYPLYTANMSSVYDMNHTKGEFYVNFYDSIISLNVNLTEDGSQSLHTFGIIPDARNVLFDIWRDYDDTRISDVAYYLKLNHSRLIMSNLKWRPELYSDAQSNVRNFARQFYMDTLEGINNTNHYVRSETADAVNGVWLDAKPTIQGFLDDLKNLTLIEEDIEEFKIFLNNSYYSNDFYIRDIINITVALFNESAMKSLPKIVQEIWAVIGESGTKIKESIIWVTEEIKIYYKNTTEFVHDLLNGDPVEHITNIFEKLIEKYDEFIKNLHISLIQYMENLWSQTYALLVQHWHNLLASLEPTFIKVLHYLESIAWNTGKELLDFLYITKNEIIESPYFVKFAKFSHDIDKFYKDITGNSTIAAIYKYSEVTVSFIKDKYVNLIPFGKELMAVVNEIIMELKQIGEIPSVKFFIDEWYALYNSGKYYYEYFNIEQRIQGLIRLIYFKLYDFETTALEMENRQREAKTKFIFDPDEGVMLLEQKLPMSWHAFNETPKFKEISELKKLYDVSEYFESSKTSFWNLYNTYKILTNPSEWFPPFKGQAMVIGSKYYITFDKKYYNFQGSCIYLLAHDFADNNFTLLSSYDNEGKNTELIILLDKISVNVNLDHDRIRIGDSKSEALPLQVRDIYLYREAGMFIMESDLGFYLQCNMKFRVCSFEMSGWYFGKTAGLWGTYNNEPSDDFLLKNKTKVNDRGIQTFADSWVLNRNCKTKDTSSIKQAKPSQEVTELCEEFFFGKMSQFSACFPVVPQDKFMSVCMASNSRQEACMTAVAYLTQCSYFNILLRIPSTCVQCQLTNGTEIQEGDFIRYQGENIPKQTDVVFIVEAKDCNKNLKQSKNFEVLIDSIERELQAQNITDNRYAVVVFGGDGIFDQPRSIVVNGQVFTNAKLMSNYFDKILTGYGNNDTFNAVMFALDLMFRPGAARNFILVPCSPCKTHFMEHDYSTIHQLLSESAISFHILMDDYFTKPKGEIKVPFGIDKHLAYSKRDIKTLIGDQALRKTIQLPKPKLGLCLSLSLENNGTVFSVKFLESDKKNAKKFATVYGQRIARSSIPSQCMDCECTASNTGISYMECYMCSMTTMGRTNVEQLFSFEDDDAFGSMNVLNGFNLYT